MSIWNATFFSAETIKWPENENYFFYIVSGDKRNEWCDLKQFGTLINFNFFLRGITKFLLFSFATRHDFCLTHRTNMKASFCENTLEQTKSPWLTTEKIIIQGERTYYASSFFQTKLYRLSILSQIRFEKHTFEQQ